MYHVSSVVLTTLGIWAIRHTALPVHTNVLRKCDLVAVASATSKLVL